MALDAIAGEAIHAPPRLVATIGIHASASTWVFNVARELLIDAVGADALAVGYADEPKQLPAAALGGARALIKSHHGGAELDAWLKARGARVVLSLRDPRDAAISMAKRFGAPLTHTAVWIAADCQRMARLLGEGHPVLRYEDRFFDDRASVDRIAGWLGLAPEPEAADAIFARYRTEAVRALAHSLAERRADEVAVVGAFRMDPVTQILAPHIGDGRSGKWRELAPPAGDALRARFLPFLELFGYPP